MYYIMGWDRGTDDTVCLHEAYPKSHAVDWAKKYCREENMAPSNHKIRQFTPVFPPTLENLEVQYTRKPALVKGIFEEGDRQQGFSLFCQVNRSELSAIC